MITITPEIFKILEEAPLFQGIPRKLLFQQLSESGLRTLNSGEALLVPSQTNNLIYIILSGRISIQSDYSDVEPIAMLGEGECVGETTIIGDGQVTAFFIAATDCQLIVIDHASMWQLIDNSHQAAHNALSVLSTRIRHASHAMTQAFEYNREFSDNPVIDEITGLYNRKWLEKKIDRFLRRFIFDRKPGCLMIVAIDKFNELGSKYGQLGCEQVLRHTAHTMLLCLRPYDQAGHFLTEQLAVFMPDTTLSNGCLAANRLRQMISESVVVLPSGDALPPISISLGICQTNSDDTPESLFARANEVLQRAAESGGNCVKCSGNDAHRETA